MGRSRREFLAGAAGVGLFGAIPGGKLLTGDDRKDGGGTGNSPKNKSSTSMVVETVYTDGIAQMSYLIGDKASGMAAIIDPTRDVERYVDLAKKHKLTIIHALETHIHADFVSGARELCDRTGTAKAHLSVEGGAKYGFKVESLKDGDKIDLGRVILTAKHTPRPYSRAHVVSGR